MIAKQTLSVCVKKAMWITIPEGSEIEDSFTNLDDLCNQIDECDTAAYEVTVNDQECNEDDIFSFIADL